MIHCNEIVNNNIFVDHHRQYVINVHNDKKHDWVQVVFELGENKNDDILEYEFDTIIISGFNNRDKVDDYINNELEGKEHEMSLETISVLRSFLLFIFNIFPLCFGLSCIKHNNIWILLVIVFYLFIEDHLM